MGPGKTPPKPPGRPRGRDGGREPMGGARGRAPTIYDRKAHEIRLASRNAIQISVEKFCLEAGRNQLYGIFFPRDALAAGPAGPAGRLPETGLVGAGETGRERASVAAGRQVCGASAASGTHRHPLPRNTGPFCSGPGGSPKPRFTTRFWSGKGVGRLFPSVK